MFCGGIGPPIPGGGPPENGEAFGIWGGPVLGGGGAGGTAPLPGWAACCTEPPTAASKLPPLKGGLIGPYPGGTLPNPGMGGNPG